MRFDLGSAPGPVTTDAALFGTWQVSTPQRQRATAAAVATAWESRPWPGHGLRAYTVLAADDGTTLLHVSQVRGLEDVPAQDLTWKQEVDAAVPGIERAGVVPAELRRSTPTHGPAADAACVVLVTRVFDGPDHTRANQLVDAMFESSAGIPPADGMLSAHFYVSTDGTQVLNYALWTSAAAHRHAIENPPPPLEATTQWQQAHSWPGLLTTTFQRFRPMLRLDPPTQ